MNKIKTIKNKVLRINPANKSTKRINKAFEKKFIHKRDCREDR